MAESERFRVSEKPVVSGQTETRKKPLLSRRQFVERTVAAFVASGAGPGLIAGVGAEARSSPDELAFVSAGELAVLIKEKRVSATEVVQAHLKRIAQVNGRLNAVCKLDAEGAMKAARAADAALARGEPAGPLHGVPFTVKDSFDTAGIVSTAGTAGRKDYIPRESAFVVQRLQRAGGILLGKTNTPELTLSFETNNVIYGRTNNPYDLIRTCGGSSGGSAAIVSAGGSPLDIGSDTSGSIRVPASFCGVAGIKPSFGLVSRNGHILRPGGVVGRRTHVGPIARSARDLALALSVIAGVDAHDPDSVPVALQTVVKFEPRGKRIAFFRESGLTGASTDVKQAVAAAAQFFASEGAIVEERRLPGFEEITELLTILDMGDGGDYFRKLLQSCGTKETHRETAAFLEMARARVVSARKYAAVLVDWARLRETALGVMSGFDLVLCPAASDVAPKHGGAIGVDFSYASMFNLLGWPAVVVRCGRTEEGLPVGVQIAGRPWSDYEVLAAAELVEGGLGGWKRDWLESAIGG